ncbi:unnamed protein product [Amaranthus hypochondriacus]
MTLKICVLLCCFISIILFGGVRGVHGTSIYNSTFTIKTERGQIYDCVDFYSQPAFSHPLLKADIHKVKPASLPRQAGNFEEFGLKDGCPLGSVPILRSFGVQQSDHRNSTQNGQHCTAVIQTEMGDKYVAANGKASVYKPRVFGNQWSVSRIKLMSGSDSIEAGWMVNPTLYKDSEAHLYARFKAGSSGCFNVECPGFVQSSKGVPLGVIPQQYSQIGAHDQQTWHIFIDKHQDDGHWWLSLGPQKEEVGYWPKTLFTTLGDTADQVEWGGEINNPDSSSPKPYMGCGQRARDDTSQSAYYSQLTVANPSFQYYYPQKTQHVDDCEDDYNTYDAGYQGDYFGHLILYGGPYDVIE